MTFSRTLRAGACISALMTATAVQADVTATQVWEAWQDGLSQYAGGAQVTTGNVDDAGDTVTVTDFAMTSDTDGDMLRVRIPQVVFTGAGDGTVAITMSDTVPVEITSQNGTAMTITVTQTGSAITASGTPDALSYEVAADQYAISIDSLTTPEGSVEGDMRITLGSVSGTTATTVDDTREVSQEMMATTVDLLADITTPDGGTLMVSGKVDGIALAASSSAPADMDLADPMAVFGGDYIAQGSVSTGPTAYIINAGGEMQVDGTSTTGPATMTFAVGPEGLSYEIAVTDPAADLTNSEMPFPLRLAASSYDIAVKAPVGPTDAPVPFRLLLGLSDVTVNDEIWAMFDPTVALPRDPATIRLDVSGAAQLDAAIMDPAQAEAMASEPGFPGKIDSLTLNELTVDAVGLSVSGTGDFTFDNSDMTTFEGLPNPTGSITIDVTGANALIDKLIAMGLIPAEQAMMPRMMLGMFATSTGDDALQSVIEVKDGQILANGQRIR